jgi:hypothetical protein
MEKEYPPKIFTLYDQKIDWMKPVYESGLVSFLKQSPAVISDLMSWLVREKRYIAEAQLPNREFYLKDVRYTPIWISREKLEEWRVEQRHKRLELDKTEKKRVAEQRRQAKLKKEADLKVQKMREAAEERREIEADKQTAIARTALAEEQKNAQRRTRIMKARMAIYGSDAPEKVLNDMATKEIYQCKCIECQDSARVPPYFYKEELFEVAM